MKSLKITFYAFLVGLTTASFGQDNVGIGTTTPSPDAVLDIQSTNQGVLVPRMTTAQRNAIVAPTEGLLVYDIDVNCFYFYESTSAAWQNLCSSGATGPQGPAGPAGPAGTNGTNGIDGAPGPQGPAGATGPQGPAGPAGVNGTDGVGITSTVDNGDGTFTFNYSDGTSFTTSDLTGPAGTPGSAGAVGPQGPAGPAGATGPAGPQGPAGATGPQGPQGSTVTPVSASLASNFTIPNSTFVNIPGVSVTFTATNTSAFVIFTSSGYGYTNSMSFVNFRIMNGAISYGGTNTNIQNYDDWTGTTTTWSCSWSRNITGLTVGTTYTFYLQGAVTAVYGTDDAVIDAVSLPNNCHATLTVIP